MSKITNVSHVRELTGLELQAVEMALEERDLEPDAGLIVVLGEEISGGKHLPFVSLQRKGSHREVIVHFRPGDRTAEQRRKDEGQSTTATAASKPATTKPSVTKKPARKR